MRRDIVLARTIRVATVASAALVVLSGVALSGCGADDGASSASSAVTPVSSDAARRQAPAAPLFNASATLTGLPAAPASDPVAQSMQASLAADSQQIAPVMRYAPGDSGDDATARN